MFRILITTAATVRNIRLMVENIITSHTGIAHHIGHNAQSTPPHHGFSLSQCWVCECRALSLSVLYSVTCLKDITFQIERLLADQSQKSLRQSKIPDLFAAK